MNKEELLKLAERGLIFRDTSIRADSINLEERSVDCILATENPVIVVDYEEWEIIREVLICTPESVEIPENRQVPLLDSHYRWTTEDLKGSIRNLQVVGAELIGRCFVDSSEDKLWGKIRDKHLTDLSGGYRTYREHTLRLKPGETGTIAGRSFTNNYGDGYTLVIRSKWAIKEGSAVAIGADSRSKFRSGVLGSPEEIKNLLKELQQARQEAKDLLNQVRNSNIQIIRSENTMDPEENQTPEQILKAENTRRKEIRETAKRFAGRIKDIDQLRETAEDQSWTVERFNAEIVQRMSTGDEFATPAADLDLSKKDRENYRIWNLVRAHMENNPKLAGLEMEASRAISERIGEAPRQNAFYIEYGHLKREITLGAPGTASNLVATELRAGNFLDLLYNKMIFGKMLNVKMINGLVGNLVFPRKVSGSEGYYIGESGVATESDINFGQQTMSPKTLSALVKYSRATALQATPEMENLVLEDVLNALKFRGDRAYVNGEGGNEVTGILIQDGVQIVSAADFNFASAVEFETALEDANFDLDQAVFLTTPLVKGQLRTRKIEAGQVPKLWEKNMLIDRTAFATKQMPANTIALIEPSEIIVGTWGILEVQINRWNDDGGVKVIPFWSHDILNRRGNSVVKASDFS